MAYTRFNIGGYRKGWFGNIAPSDTYIYGDQHNLNCCACRLMPFKATEKYFDAMDKQRDELNARWKENGSKTFLPPVDRTVRFVGYDTWTTNSRRAMLKHIKRHRKAGHAVPKSASSRIWREYKRIGDEY